MKKQNQVYFIQCGDYVKIGFSSKLTKRMLTIQTHNPYLVFVLFTLKGSAGKEKVLHKQFKKYRSSGEWFRIEGDLKKFIETKTRIKNMNKMVFDTTVEPKVGSLVYAYRGENKGMSGRIIKRSGLKMFYTDDKYALITCHVRISNMEHLKNKTIRIRANKLAIIKRESK